MGDDRVGECPNERSLDSIQDDHLHTVIESLSRRHNEEDPYHVHYSVCIEVSKRRATVQKHSKEKNNYII